MKKKVTIITLVGLIFILLTGAFLVVMLSARDKGDTKAVKKDITMFSAYTDCEEFQNVPAMVTAEGKIYDAEDYGKGHYIIGVNGSTVEEYKTYLTTLEQAGYTKHSDNGEDAMEGYALTASYTKDNLTVTVAQAINLERTYITAAYDMPLSKHLVYKDEYVENVSADAKTKVHMPQLKESGASFMIQLKNGHFVVYDGGGSSNATNFLEYLEELTPGDEKPVIEAWFMSHAHNDHSGVMTEIATNLSYAERIYVEGVYYVRPSDAVISQLTSQSDPINNQMIVMSSKSFKTQSGETTKLYRPQFGQRYYFCDIVIDVTLTVEQIPSESYYGVDFNDVSTWLMAHIDNQRFLFAGDTSFSGIYTAMDIFDESYFATDVFATFHHGINVYEFFNEYCTYETVLYTGFRTASVWDTREDLAAKDANEQMKAKSKEYYSYGEGTVVLTFPYTVGKAEILEGEKYVYDPF